MRSIKGKNAAENTPQGRPGQRVWTALRVKWGKRAEKRLYLWLLLAVSQGEGNGTPLQCSCLENPMDGGAW